MARLQARGKFLFDGDRKFYARGVSYGPFAPNSRGERYPEPERAAADFAMMRDLGANLVRTYVPPPDWMFELAAKSELKMLVGMPWPFHMTFLDSPDMMRDIRRTVRDGVSSMRRFGETILAYSLGNEIRSDIVRWHGPRAVSRFLSELYDSGKQIDPDGLFTYSNYPSAEYIDLSFLDLICFNVYLHREEDYRRYLTHLLAATAERPLILSETGMDTIREGEEHQAELLSWQARAAFELGLSGFIVFAFTDEWHTGGAEIADWAFGLVRRDRSPKRSFVELSALFREPLPPRRPAPRASIIVAAHNAAPTLGRCLESLSRLNYPDFETIVVDDGSTDSTAQIAEAGKAKVIRQEHKGLGAARNAGVRAANGQIIAFIDADAEADQDWLYHLAETISRRAAVAAGGPNFPPAPESNLAAAIAAAPGAPREVRSGDDELAQLCGCNMAVVKDVLDEVGGFDEGFTAAGDDVDLSWRLRERFKLAAAPGAVVIHQRRKTIGAYLAQQRGYGTGEGLLFRKYPTGARAAESLYGETSWLAWLTGPRVYYGSFGRGLFQSLYPSGQMPPAAELALTVPWIALALVMIAAGTFSAVLELFGCAAGAVSIACALTAATRAPLDRRHSGPLPRSILAFLFLAGPLVRSFCRERVSLRFANADTKISERRFEPNGQILFNSADRSEELKSGTVVDAMHRALLHKGLAVAVTDGFEPYDLQIVVPPAIRVPLNAFREPDGRVAIGWRLTVALWPVAVVAAVTLILTLAAQLPLNDTIVLLVAIGLGAAVLAISRVRRLPGILRAAASEAADRARCTVDTGRDQAA